MGQLFARADVLVEVGSRRDVEAVADVDLCGSDSVGCLLVDMTLGSANARLV